VDENWKGLIAGQASLLFQEARFSNETLAALRECWAYRQAENERKSNKYGQWFYLTLAAAALFSDEISQGVAVALAMEFLTLGADILDDLADQDNDTAPWRRMAPAIAMHALTCFLTLSFQVLANINYSYRFQDLTSLFSATWNRACDGQIREICRQQAQITQDEYLQIIGCKAASLTGCACRAGALAGGAGSEGQTLMSRFGHNIGIIAQIHNDLRDILDITGKSDFSQRKQSLPVIYLQNVLQEEPTWDRDGLRQLLKEKGAIAYCDFICEAYASEALTALDQVNAPMERKKGLMSIVAP
jgi:competence protein ComQ